MEKSEVQVQFQFTLMMWLVFLNQAHKMGKRIRRGLTFEFAHKMNTFLSASTSMYNYTKVKLSAPDLTALEDDFAVIIEGLAKLSPEKRPQLISLIKAGLSDNVTISADFATVKEPELPRKEPFTLVPECPELPPVDGDPCKVLNIKGNEY